MSETARSVAKIAAVVLAAGSSRRFGTANKLLADIDGRPMIGRVLTAIEAAGIDHIVVVTGHDADRITAATAGPGRRHVFNPRHDEGIGTSVAAGISALGEPCDGVLVAQGDMPGVDRALVADLVRLFREAHCDRVVYPRLTDGRQGNPVLWPGRLFAALQALGGDTGAKRLIAAEGERAIALPASDDTAGVDIDTEAALAAYVERNTGGSTKAQ